MENNKNPKGRRTKRAARLGRRRRRRLVVFHLAVETRNKKPHENQKGISEYQSPAPASDQKYQTFCGT